MLPKFGPAFKDGLRCLLYLDANIKIKLAKEAWDLMVYFLNYDFIPRLWLVAQEARLPPSVRCVDVWHPQYLKIFLSLYKVKFP